MVTILLLAAAWGGWCALRAVLATLRELPRDNDDLVFY